MEPLRARKASYGLGSRMRWPCSSRKATVAPGLRRYFLRNAAGMTIWPLAPITAEEGIVLPLSSVIVLLRGVGVGCEFCEGTAFAFWFGAAVGFADHDDEGVEFVVVLSSGFGWFVVERVNREGLDFVVLCFFGQELVAGCYSAKVFVNDHGGVVEGVEEDGVGGFGADSWKSEEFGAGDVGWFGGEVVEAAMIFGVQEGDECFEGGGFANHIAGGSDELAKLVFGEVADGGDGVGVLFGEVLDGVFYGSPGGVLG